ncbi:hypothetical protein HMF8227_02340 [Saliniradius amylolyticus]|uniref:Uncharacterized protein n=1 Tax=Saliniradius amylolyticus TaxID=2183582 RepID=A0A2S2E5I4_9ALTE|nr:hypothetical protein [Saliniradius amylolyticus]AWL12792.1 hypothetical protein HMF8227_02340 [Saliniradius amylolyticus]
MSQKKALKNNPTLSVRGRELKARVIRLATLDKRPPSQMAAVLLEEAVQAEEEKLKLAAIDKDPDYRSLIA